MERNPANNCVASRLNFTPMLKRLEVIVAGMEEQSRTGRSWLNTTITAVNEAIGFIRKKRTRRQRVIRVKTRTALTVSAAVGKMELFFQITTRDSINSGDGTKIRDSCEEISLYVRL